MHREYTKQRHNALLLGCCYIFAGKEFSFYKRLIFFFVGDRGNLALSSIFVCFSRSKPQPADVVWGRKWDVSSRYTTFGVGVQAAGVRCDLPQSVHYFEDEGRSLGFAQIMGL